MNEHRCPWLEAAECARLRLVFFRADERVREPLRSLHLHLFTMCRAEFAAERSYSRFGEATAGVACIDGLLLQYLEAHSFLVSAKLAWETFDGVKLSLVTLRPPRDFREELKALTARHATVRRRLANAQSHIEHIAERIRESQTARYPDGLSTERWRRSIGQCEPSEGRALIFGDERFDLDEQLAALVHVRDAIAPTLATLVTPSDSARMALG